MNENKTNEIKKDRKKYNINEAVLATDRRTANGAWKWGSNLFSFSPLNRRGGLGEYEHISRDGAKLQPPNDFYIFIVANVYARIQYN